MTTDRKPQTVTLAEFLLARIAEDEERWLRSPHGEYLGNDVRNHILGECEAKRRIVELHEPHPTSLVGIDDADEGYREIEVDSFEEITGRDVNCMTCAGYPSASCQTLRLLALPYVNHTDYDESWRP